MGRYREGDFVIGIFDWSNGPLRLRLVRRDSWDNIVADPSESTDNPHLAVRWSSRQAATQWLNRHRESGDRRQFGEAWRVISMRALHGPRR